MNEFDFKVCQELDQQARLLLLLLQKVGKKDGKQEMRAPYTTQEILVKQAPRKPATI